MSTEALVFEVQSKNNNKSISGIHIKEVHQKFGPRPPIEGRETSDVNVEFIEKATSRLPREGAGGDGGIKSIPWDQKKPGGGAKQAQSKMAPSPKATSDSGSVRGFEPEGSADVTPPFSESSASQQSSGPAYMRWAENLHNLLGDPDGVELYKNYLKTENVGELLDFWFACEGLKRLPSDQTEKMFQLVKVINRKFLRSKVVPIAEGTRKTIQESIGSKQEIYQHIFDPAQLEVEERMTRTTYRNFLASEMYLNYIQQMQTGESDLSAKATPGSHSTESSLSGREGGGSSRQTTQDDSGHFSVGVPSTSQVSAVRQQGDNTSDSTSGISDTSSLPPPLPTQPPVAPNTSLDVSNLDDTSNTTHNQSHLVASGLPTLHEDSELDMSQPSPTLPSLPANLIQSLTNMSAKKRITGGPAVVLKQPEAQAGLYLRPGPGGVPHPYHAYNSAYNPVSRQDSELQSLSSDAQTTDDNQSSFTESSSHFSNNYRSITNKKYLKRQARRMQEQSRHNREAIPGQHTQNTFIPRTARIPVEASNQLPPTEFAAVLTQKLEKLKREQELNEKLNKKLSEDAGSLVSQGSNRSLADILREKLIIPDDGDGDQSILDEHVSRIWTDKTPLRSPGDPSGRPRSPGASRRSRGGGQGPGATKMGPPVGVGPRAMQQNRTLPARGPGRMLPPQVVGGPGAGSLYHQDLAYYEVERVPGAARGAEVVGPGTNDRVMEWMLDVERQTDRGQPDQRSQSSKGATKTSPRSGREKQHLPHGHRSMSQERSVMSSSWAAGSREQLQYQQRQMEDKRRVQPGASNNSTLRKPAGAGRALQPGEVTVAVYTFSHEKGEPMPYRIKIPSKSVTLKLVKELLPKKGTFRFYFKTEIDGDMCYEEETEDSSLVPLWEGKVLVQCRLVE